MTDMSGERIDGSQYDIEVVRGVTFRSYQQPDYTMIEVSVEDGVICHNEIPDEIKTADEARAWAALLMAAADELEREQAGRAALEGGE